MVSWIVARNHFSRGAPRQLRGVLQRLSGLQPLDLGEAALEPANAALARIARARLVRLAGNDVIELHDDVGAQVALDLHHDLGGEKSAGAVDVGLELDAFLADDAKPLERENLESARVGEDRPVPLHEAVESSHLAHDVVALSLIHISEPTRL